MTAQQIDKHVGERLRARREQLALSQARLAAHLGVSFSQVQKYERGANRIGAGRLYITADVLEVPVSYFFDGLPAPVPAPSSGDRGSAASARALADAFCAIGDPGTRESVLALVRSLVEPAAMPRAISVGRRSTAG